MFKPFYGGAFWLVSSWNPDDGFVPRILRKVVRGLPQRGYSIKSCRGSLPIWNHILLSLHILPAPWCSVNPHWARTPEKNASDSATLEGDLSLDWHKSNSAFKCSNKIIKAGPWAEAWWFMSCVTENWSGPSRVSSRSSLLDTNRHFEGTSRDAPRNQRG